MRDEGAGVSSQTSKGSSKFLPLAQTFSVRFGSGVSLRRSRYIPKPSVSAAAQPQSATLGSRQDQNPHTPKALHRADGLVKPLQGMALLAIGTQGAPLRGDPGLWSLTPSA